MEQIPIKDIITRLGGPTAVGKRLGVTHGAVCQWEQVPVDHVPDLVLFSHEKGDPIHAEEMRPDKPWAAVCRPIPKDDFSLD